MLLLVLVLVVLLVWLTQLPESSAACRRANIVGRLFDEQPLLRRGAVLSSHTAQLQTDLLLVNPLQQASEPLSFDEEVAGHHTRSCSRHEVHIAGVGTLLLLARDDICRLQKLLEQQRLLAQEPAHLQPIRAVSVAVATLDPSIVAHLVVVVVRVVV